MTNTPSTSKEKKIKCKICKKCFVNDYWFRIHCFVTGHLDDRPGIFDGEPNTSKEVKLQQVSLTNLKKIMIDAWYNRTLPTVYLDVEGSPEFPPRSEEEWKFSVAKDVDKLIASAKDELLTELLKSNPILLKKYKILKVLETLK